MHLEIHPVRRRDEVLPRLVLKRHPPDVQEGAGAVTRAHSRLTSRALEQQVVPRLRFDLDGADRVHELDHSHIPSGRWLKLYSPEAFMIFRMSSTELLSLVIRMYNSAAARLSLLMTSVASCMASR